MAHGAAKAKLSNARLTRLSTRISYAIKCLFKAGCRTQDAGQRRHSVQLPHTAACCCMQHSLSPLHFLTTLAPRSEAASDGDATAKCGESPPVAPASADRKAEGKLHDIQSRKLQVRGEQAVYGVSAAGLESAMGGNAQSERG